MKTKDEYIEKLASELNEWCANIDLLSAKIEASTDMAKLKYIQELNALHVIQLAAAEKIKELENTSGDNWETVKHSADMIWDDLRTGLDGADFTFQ